jgi:peroxiredoxin
MTKKISLITLLFIFIAGCQPSEKPVSGEFKLNAKVKGIENNPWVYLLLNNETYDSTKIANHQFSFKGQLEHPMAFDLYIENSRNHTSIWLEPGTIEFYAEDGKFKDAVITGSNSQEDSDRLWKPIWQYRKKRDSLNKILDNKAIAESEKTRAKAELKDIWSSHLSIEKAFIKNNPDSYVSASTLDFYTTSIEKEKVEELYNSFSERLKNSSYGKSIQRYLELQKNLKPGDNYVDFSMKNAQNENVNLSDFEGKLILIDFWASWCVPCLKEFPALKEAYNTYQKDGFEIVGISEDESKKAWTKAIEKFELNWTNLWDDAGSSSDPYLIYNVSGIPDNFLINKEGVIIARGLRGEELIEAVKQEIEKEKSSS